MANKTHRPLTSRESLPPTLIKQNFKHDKLTETPKNPFKLDPF